MSTNANLAIGGGDRKPQSAESIFEYRTEEERAPLHSSAPDVFAWWIGHPYSYFCVAYSEGSRVRHVLIGGHGHSNLCVNISPSKVASNAPYLGMPIATF